MKRTLLILTFFITFLSAKSQIKVEPITYKEQNHFITTTIGYPVAGLYLFDEKTEPTILLNADATGILQDEDLTKKDITWGIECTEEGIPIFKEGFNSASYTFWYKTNDSEDWTFSQFSIHYNKKKMFIMGERVKSYDEEVLKKSTKKIPQKRS